MKRLVHPILCASLLLLLPGCEGPRGHEPQEPLRVGAFVEAKGSAAALPARVEQVTALPRKADDTADKFEIVAPVESVPATESRPRALRLLGTTLEVNERTEFENRERQTVPPFEPPPGSWVKVKAKAQESGAPRARTVRAVDPEDRFTVVGEVRELDLARGLVRIGSVPLQNGSARDARGGTEGNPASDDPLAQFQSDETRSVPFTVSLGKGFRAGGQLSFSQETNDEYDLDETNTDDRTTREGEAKLDLLWTIDQAGSFALVEGAVARRERYREGSDDTHSHKEEVSRAYAFLRLGGGFSVQAGRQDFYDEREWLYDEILDGARLRWSVGNLGLEAGAAAGRELLAQANDTEDTSLFTGLARYRLTDDHRLTVYALQRKDHNTVNFEPFLVGFRSYSRPSEGLGHWFELASATGYVGRTRIDGWGIDGGLMYRFDAALDPTIAVGYAFGSGRDDGKIGFRQSGLQDNNGKFGGVTRFRYYGEVLEPELANLAVTTCNVGIRPFRNFAVDATFHTYRQDVAATTQADTELRTSPNGTSKDLGYAADLVFGFRAESTLTLELALGLFEPGHAFDERDAAHKIAFVGRFKF